MTDLSAVLRSIENAALIGSWRNCAGDEHYDTARCGMVTNVSAPSQADLLAWRDYFFMLYGEGQPHLANCSEPVRGADGKWWLRSWRAKS